MLIRNQDIRWKEETKNIRAWSKDLITSSSSRMFSAHHLKIEPGGEILAHTHAIESELHFVIAGQGQALLDGKWESVGEGDVVLAHATVPHGLKNDGATPLFVLCVFAPPLV